MLLANQADITEPGNPEWVSMFFNRDAGDNLLTAPWGNRVHGCGTPQEAENRRSQPDLQSDSHSKARMKSKTPRALPRPWRHDFSSNLFNFSPYQTTLPLIAATHDEVAQLPLLFAV